MDVELDEMLRKVEAGRWHLDAVDWDAPGAGAIRPAQYQDLKRFMSDLVWIEHVGARGFAALADKAEDSRLREIYRHFEREEEQHAKAELKLMRRWGMVEPGEIPDANINVRLVVTSLDRFSHTLNFATLTCVIAMLEVALDGALVKFLLDEVEDPLCHEVFAHINRDEARHLAVDFHVMELNGMKPQLREKLVILASAVRPERIFSLFAYVPLLSRMRNNLMEMGFDEERLYKAIRRFDQVGSRSPYTERSPAYRAIRAHCRMVVDREHPYHYFADAMVALTSYIPPEALGPLPPWAQALAEEHPS